MPSEFWLTGEGRVMGSMYSNLPIGRMDPKETLTLLQYIAQRRRQARHARHHQEVSARDRELPDNRCFESRITWLVNGNLIDHGRAQVFGESGHIEWNAEFA